MQTETKFYVGSAQRFIDNPPQYVVGRQEFSSLEKARNYIANLVDDYAERGVALEPEEFVPVEIKTTIYTTMD